MDWSRREEIRALKLSSETGNQLGRREVGTCIKTNQSQRGKPAHAEGGKKKKWRGESKQSTSPV